jgi:hypothetical protein
MDTKHPDYQKRDAAQRAKDRLAREARRVRPAIKAVVAVAPIVERAVEKAADWSVPVSMPRVGKDKK